MPSGRIVVIGAGLAGLTVADELHRRGFNVCVLEARDRVGGRCHTVDGVDMGAHWIHGTEGNPVTGLARRLGLPTIFVGGDSTFTGGWDAVEIRCAGALTFDDDKLASVLAADEMWDALEVLRRERIAGDDNDISLADAVTALRRSGRLPSESRDIDWHLELLAREDAGCGSGELSLIAWDEGVDVYGYGDSVLAGGYGPLTEALAKPLDVRLGTVVRTIDGSDPQEVRITTHDGEVIVAELAVVTVPLGVLKSGSIEFIPPLPQHKQTAIDRLGVGVLAKLVLRFEDVWWRDDQYVFGVACAPIERWPTVIINTAAIDREPVLVVLAGGDLGRWVETAPTNDVERWSAELIAEVFGPDAPVAISVERTSWSTDPFSLGSYSAMVVGASAVDIRALAEPFGPVHFAGEATSASNWSTAHGAVLSGRREAARIAGDPSIARERFISETRRWRRQQQRVMRFHNAVSGRLSDQELEKRIELLGLNTAFDDVPPRDLEAFASMLDEQFHETGTVLCHVGDIATEVFIIIEGEVVALVAESARRTTMRRSDMIGELGLFVHSERTADLVVTQACRLLALDYDRFRRFLLAFPEASLALLGASITRITDAERRG